MGNNWYPACRLIRIHCESICLQEHADEDEVLHLRLSSSFSARGIRDSSSDADF